MESAHLINNVINETTNVFDMKKVWQQHNMSNDYRHEVRLLNPFLGSKDHKTNIVKLLVTLLGTKVKSDSR
jgi:hypothetical protein